MKRKCGRCKLCCKVYAIPELNKGFGEWCQHCPYTGCKIYDTRPAVCRDFRCLWLEGRLPSSWRPDLIHIVFRHCLTVDSIPLITAHESHKGALQKSKLTQLAKSGIGVMVICDGLASCILGPMTLTRDEAQAWCRKVDAVLDPLHALARYLWERTGT